jgi:hypothetical protein
MISPYRWKSRDLPSAIEICRRDLGIPKSWCKSLAGGTRCLTGTLRVANARWSMTLKNLNPQETFTRPPRNLWVVDTEQQERSEMPAPKRGSMRAGSGASAVHGAFFVS